MLGGGGAAAAVRRTWRATAVCQDHAELPVTKAWFDPFALSRMREADIFYCMVTIDLEIALASNIQVKETVFTQLLQHMVEESNTGLYAAYACTIKING